MLINLKDETLEILNKHGKTWDDVEWVGSVNWNLTVDKNQFLILADREYNNGYGGNEVSLGLVVVGKDFWLERHEYDGSEWWEFKQIPKKPVIMLEDNLAPFLYNCLEW